jgi:hypothetical protein
MLRDRDYAVGSLKALSSGGVPAAVRFGERSPDPRRAHSEILDAVVPTTSPLTALTPP